MEIAYFAAGCFWGVEGIFMKLDGVISTSVGYMNGTEANPNYKSVCAGNSGHAEVVKLEFKSNIISYSELLNVFFDLHNPTTINRQGPDIGSQYRSAIFTLDKPQLEQAQEYIDKLTAEKKFSNPIITILEPAKEFYRAEEYHQRYFQKNGGGACKL
jgi:peptide-methionine (S)-S-oxide reductase